MRKFRFSIRQMLLVFVITGVALAICFSLPIRIHGWSILILDKDGYPVYVIGDQRLRGPKKDATIVVPAP